MLRFSVGCLGPVTTVTPFHHQPEAQHPKSSAIHKMPADYPIFHVRPAWASTWRWKSSRELVTASEANRRASFREAGVKEAGSEAAGRRIGTGYKAEPSRASGHER